VADRTPPAVPGRDGRDALELALRINDAILRNRERAPFLNDAIPCGTVGKGRSQP